MKEKINSLKNLTKTSFWSAFVLALAGTALSMLLVTLFSTNGVFRQFSPVWIFVVYSILYFVTDMLPVKKEKPYIIPLVFGGLTMIILLIFML